MKWCSYIFFALLFLPSIALGDECNFPIFSSDSQINGFLLENYVATNDNKSILKESDLGCLDRPFLVRELSRGGEMAEFELGFRTSLLEVRLAKILRNLYKDPDAHVYLCPNKNKEFEFKILTQSAFNFITQKSGLPMKEVEDKINKGYLSQSCRLVPRFEVEAGPRNIPPRILAHIITELPKILGKPFPPEIHKDLEKTRPLELNSSRVKISPIPLM